MENAIQGYHHGDLRKALIAAGMDLIRQRAADDLSLREVARQVGVSATAIYRHFPDKQALLYALCVEGAEALAGFQRKARDDAKGGVKGFEAAARAYIYFALENPGLYRLMMATKASRDIYDAEATAMSGPMELMKSSIAEVMPQNATAQEQKVAVLHAWSLVHGISMLMLDGLVSPDGAVIDALVSMPLDQIIARSKDANN